jgi:predicted transcriptional regulator
MRLSDIKDILECRLVSPITGLEADADIEIRFAYASDLMSDILVAVKPGALLLTGLTNNQVIRTSKVAATSAIVFVRGKKPTDQTVKLAEQYHIPVLTTKLSMFDACGILFAKGVKGVSARR